MKNQNIQQVQVLWVPNMKVNNLEEIWKNRKWVRVEIPWVFDYINSVWKNQTLYTNSDWVFFDLKWNRIEDEIDENTLSKKYETMTKLDLLNFQWLNDLEIEQLIVEELFTKEERDEWTNTQKEEWGHKNNESLLDTNEWISKVNNIFKSWYDLLSKVWRKVPGRYDNYKMFLDKAELINFCKITQNEWTKDAYINCMLTKSSFIVSDILNNKTLELLSNKEKVLISILKEREEFNFDWNKWTLEIYWEKMSFSLVSRAKSKFSSQLKVWKDPMYHSSTIMDDWLGLTFYIEDKENSTIFLNHVNRILFPEKNQKDKCYDDGNIKVETKWSFVNPKTNKWKDKIWYFLDRVIVKEAKPWTNDRYWDLKSKSVIQIPNSIGEYNKWVVWDNVKVEIKIVDYDTKNDDWLSFHPVFWYLKYIEAQIRLLQWYISEKEIDNIVNLFFYNLDDNLNEKNEHIPEWYEKTKQSYLKELWDDLQKNWLLEQTNMTRSPTEEELRDWLRKYYLNKFIKVKVWKKKEKFLTTKRDYHLSLSWHRPEMKKDNS